MAKAKTLISSDDIENWLITEIAALRGTNPNLVDARAAFSMYLDSVSTTSLTARLASELKRPLPPTLFWDHPSIQKLSAFLESGDVDESGETRARAKIASEPVAVVGIACRFPGGADDPRKYWEILMQSTDAVGMPDESRREEEARRRDEKEREHSSRPPGGYLKGVYDFEPEFFDISPGEALHMDPQQRLALELAWEGLEDAGIPPARLRNSRTGVFMGAMWSEYNHHGTELSAHSATGRDLSIISARIAYFLGLRGPALTVNTACSSSLVAIHTAMQYLRSGEIETAMVGGVSLILSEQSTEAISRFGALSPNHRCAAFDAGADGYVRGEGAGLIVLKPLSRALRDGNSIYCLIRGGAVNNDGASNGLAAPSGAAQEAVIRDALSSAGTPAGDVQYVETHGTGTRLGDPIEAEALGAAYAIPDRRPLRIGAVKTNLGHLEAAAGMAGFIKTALALRHRRLPANALFREPNPHIDFKNLKLEVQNKASDWPDAEKILAAGVSSFGFGGTNAHLILEEYASRESLKASLKLPAPSANPEPVAFVFAGGGHQWVGMGRDLVARESVFYDRLRRCDEHIRALGDWSLMEELLSGANFHRWDILHPVLTALQLGLTDLWQSLGLWPDTVIGHSGGEVAAACAAGILTEEQTMRIAFHRGRLQQRASGRGGMTQARINFEDAAALLHDAPGVNISAVNGPESVVFSGERAALDALVPLLEEREASPRNVRVEVPGHGPAMDSLKEEFYAALKDIRPGPGDTPMVSSIDGRMLPGTTFDAHYWARNLREPVRFDLALRALLKKGIRTFLEISAHPVLTAAINDSDPDAAAWPTLRREESAKKVMGETGKALGTNRKAPESTHLFTMSAHSAESLRERTRDLLAWSRKNSPEPADLCAANLLGRNHLDYRWAMGIADIAELHEKLERFLKSPGDTRIAFTAKPSLAFIFAGQGSEWVGMGREMFALDSEFRAAMRRCDSIFREYSGWSLLEKLEDISNPAGLMETAAVQACLFAVQTSLAKALRARGIVPDAVMGHSVGEIAAAHDAGILSLSEALRIIHYRGTLMSRPEYRGRMLEARVDEREASGLLSDFKNRVCIAAVNSPETTVFSGDSPAMREFRSHLRARGIQNRLLRTRYGFHGPRMENLLRELPKVLNKVRPEPSATKFYSSVTAGPLSGLDLNETYWGRNAAAPVRFSRTMERMLEDGTRVFVEISPRTVLGHYMEEFTLRRDRKVLVIPAARRNEPESRFIANRLAALYRAGYPLGPAASPARRVPALRGPAYPWRKKTYRIESEPAKESIIAPPRNRGVDLHRLRWEPRETQTAETSKTGPLFIFSADSRTAEELERIARNAGEHIQSTDPQSVGKLGTMLDNLPANVRPRILYLTDWTSGKESLRPAPPLALLEIASTLRDRSADLWIITAGMLEPVHGRADQFDPDQAALRGLGRVLALESNQSRVRLADLTRAAAMSTAVLRERCANLLRIIRAPGEDDQFIIGARRTYTPFLTPSEPVPPGAPRFRADASYLITGGTGGIGRLLARRLLSEGAGRVYLAARETPDLKSDPEFRDERIHFIQCDVSLEQDVMNMLDEIGPDLRGIFHAAGVDLSGTGREISSSHWDEIMAPKVMGVRLLHKHTEAMALDFFVCVSSTSAVWGSARLGAYAAANAYMDAFMDHRRALGLPAFTINFGPWRDTGMVVQANVAFESGGVVPIQPGHYLDAFMALLNEDRSHELVARLDAGRFTELMRARGRGNFVSRITANSPSAPPAEIVGNANENKNGHAKVAGEPEKFDRPPAFKDALPGREQLSTLVRNTIRELLGAPHAPLPEDLGFFQLGLDSLLTVEMRNRLGGKLGLELAPTTLLEYPSIAELTEYLASLLFPESSPGKSRASGRRELTPEDLPRILEDAAQMSDRDVLRNLRGA